MFLTKLVLKEFKEILERLTKVEVKVDRVDELENQIKTQQVVIVEMVESYNYLIDVMMEIDKNRMSNYDVERKSFASIMEEAGLEWQN